MTLARRLHAALFFGLVLGPHVSGAAPEFRAPFVAYPTGALPLGVAAGDLDGDARLDLVTTDSGNATLGVRLALANGRFGPRIDVPTDTGPSAIALGRLDDDAFLDAVVACYDADRVDVLRGHGDGTFEPDTTLVSAPDPKAIAVAMFDGDGRLDVVTLDSPYNHPPGGLSIWLRAGDGGFAPRQEVHPGGKPVSLRAGDLDGDGRAELVVAQTDPEAIVILWNDGSGAFPTQSVLPLAGTPVGLDLGEWNGDGRLDGAVYIERVELGTLVLRIQPWIGGSDGTPVAMPEVLSWGYGADLRHGDLDGDGHADLVVLGTVASVHRGRGDGSFEFPRPFDAGNVCWTGVVAEFDGDGAQDIAVAATDSWALTLLHGNGDGTLGVDPVRTSPNPVAVAAARLDADDAIDLVAASTSPDHIVVHAGDGDGGFGAGRTQPAPPEPAAFAVADVDTDGANDVVATTFAANGVDGHLAVLRGDGQGQLTIASEVALAAGATAIVVGDWNEDGAPDVAATVWTQDWPLDAAVETRLGHGDGTFDAATLHPVGPLPMGIACGDFDDDGHLDLVASFRQTAQGPVGGLTLLRGDGQGGFGSRVDLDTGPEPRGVALADVDRDGRMDLVVAHSNFARFAPGEVAVLRGAGGGAFAAPARFATGMETTALVLADFDGDDILDIAASNAASNTVSVLAGTGDGGFANRTDWGTGARPLGLAAADFDADGRIDLVAADTRGSALTVLQNRTLVTAIVVHGLAAAWCGDAVCLSWNVGAGGVACDGIGVERALAPAGPWTPLTPTLLPPQPTMRFVDAGGRAGDWYRLRVHAAAGRLQVVGPVTAGDAVHGRFVLDAPLVAGGSVMIRFMLPRAVHDLRVDVVDVRGRIVRAWSLGGMPAGRGTLEWDRADTAARPVARGIYWVRLVADGQHRSRRVVLARR